MIRRLLCALGWHRWIYGYAKNGAWVNVSRDRHCTDCERREVMDLEQPLFYRRWRRIR